MLPINTIQISGPVKSSTKQTISGHSYEVLTCDSDLICFDDHVSGKYRSIVCDPNTHHILSYSPQCADQMDAFKTKYPEYTENMFVSEIVEGTMINLFYDPVSKLWEIATRGSVGGNYWYNRTQYSKTEEGQLTFRQMFVEALHYTRNTELEKTAIAEYLDKNYSYSFVLQHPDNHMVYTVKNPTLTLVAIYELSNSADSGEECVFSGPDADGAYSWNMCPRVRYVSPLESKIWASVENALQCNVIQIVDGIQSFDEFNRIEPSSKNTRSGGLDIRTKSIYTPMGWMLTHAITGDRVAKENPHYQRLKELRGNNPNLLYQYLSLYRIGKVSDFLEWFPMYKKSFFEFYTQYHSFITEVHNAYVSYYVLKDPKQIPKKYFIHAAKIHHDVYLPSLSKQKIIITHRVVREHFDQVAPGKMLYYMRYEEPVDSV